ncbi:hypothetical protein DER46DRAFT_666213 [Fusarium sp. MPI-SDFR-AT-0072]|nr:hypothetical protein DER46DRAFT_666213 [Fusarium sp. MPI-SDFR-AT-0072]
MSANKECHSNLGQHKLASLTQDGRAEAVGLKSLDAGEFQDEMGLIENASSVSDCYERLWKPWKP